MIRTNGRVTAINGNSNNDDDDDNEILNNPDECPVCHSKRYLRPDMRFLINPVCYHKMCDSCVDRIFGHGGPAICPIRGCGKTLRKMKFRPPTFDDMKMEREVDIRKEIAETFNQREDEFETLRDYNKYLNDVEDLTFDLINSVNVEKRRQELADHKLHYKDSIAQNRKLNEMNDGIQKQRLLEQQRQSQLSRLAAFNEVQEEKREKDNARKDIINRLEHETGDAKAIALQGEQALRAVADRKSFAPVSTDTFAIRGFRKSLKLEPEKPFDPFGGMTFQKDFVVIPDQTNLWNDYLGKLRKENIYKAGGYSLNEFYDRALTEAFGGLGISIKSEKAQSRKPSSKTVDTFS